MNNKQIILLALTASLASLAVAGVAVAADEIDWSKSQDGDPSFFDEDANGDPIFPDMNETPRTVCRTIHVNFGYNLHWNLQRVCEATECCTTSCRTGPNGIRACFTSCVITAYGACHLHRVQ